MASNTQMLMDGYQTIVTLENVPLIKLYEKTVTPPAFDGQAPIENTTMRNSTWRTTWPRSLKSVTAITTVVAYATEALSQILAQINVNQQLTVQWPDTSTMVVWGSVTSFTPSNHAEGEQPTATLVFTPSNRNVDKVETGPVYSAPTES